ncbi:fibronectin type III domain-containing protein [candidate division WOR-3 bacterium]|nr:fibronectin type III domain-containing protein [candidate division WOR-3 bacterium]
MKRAFLLAAVTAAAVSLVIVGGCILLGGPPTSLDIGAATDSTVQLTWTTPAEGSPDAYVVLFKPVTDTNYSQIAETTGTAFIHNPQGMTGAYKVGAKFGSDVYESRTVLSTVPIHESTRAVSELDGAGNAGYGWARDSGNGRTYSMRLAANSAHVDFYISDFQTGSNRWPYCVAGPQMWTQEPSGVIPSAGWRTNGFTDPLASEQALLPAYSPNAYFNYTEVRQLPCFIGAYTTWDKHFALIKVTQVSLAQATAELETWFQLVPELRLTRH